MELPPVGPDATQAGSPPVDKVVRRRGSWCQQAKLPSTVAEDGQPDAKEAGSSPLPDKVVVRNLNLASQGRSQSLTALSTIDTSTRQNSEASLQSSEGNGVSKLPARVQSFEGGREASRLSPKISPSSSMGMLSSLPRRHSTIEGLPSSPMGMSSLPRRHSTIDGLPSSSMGMPSLPRRHSTIEGLPSSSMTSLTRRGSTASLTGWKPALAAIEGSDEHCAKDTLDMSPRTARRYLIHQHRLSIDTSIAEHGHHSHHGHHRHHHHQSRRGSRLGAESLEILHPKPQEEEDLLYGFLVGDKVSTAGGTDADGPWKGMGDGQVEGPTQGKKGHINVRFAAISDGTNEQKEGASFSIKAVNLRNLTDPSRSGKYNAPAEPAGNLRKRSKDLSKPTQGSTVSCRGSLLDTEQQATYEPTAYTFRDGLESIGLEIGDMVGSISTGSRFQPLGVVVKEGAKAGEVLVRVGDLGIRSFHGSQLTKIHTEVDKKQAAREAAYVDPKKKNACTLTLSEASGGASRDGEKPVVEEADPMAGFVVGDFVKVRDDCDESKSFMWQALGIGCVRGYGTKEGTLQVQFDSGGEEWTLFSKQLQIVPKKDCTDRAFRTTSHKMLKRRGSI